MNDQPRFQSWSASLPRVRATPSAWSIGRFWRRIPKVKDAAVRDQEIENGHAIALIAQAVVITCVVALAIWGIGQATAAQDRTLAAHAQVQP